MRRPLLHLALAIVALAAAANCSREAATATEVAAALAAAREATTTEGPRAALPMFHRALRTARAAGDRRGEAIALGGIGVCYKNIGEYQQALRFHQQALQIKRELGDAEQEAR